MGTRDRVAKAIETQVDVATELLRNTSGAELETRLTMLIDGWGRGLAAGLEQLASAVDDLSRRAQDESAGRPQPSPAPTPSDRQSRISHKRPVTGQREAESADRTSTAKHDRPTETSDAEDAENDEDEEQLRVRVAKSQEATAALRDETNALADENDDAKTLAGSPKILSGLTGDATP